MVAAIENNRIAGTRITVWDVLHHSEHGWPHVEIARVLSITVEQVEAAARYIDEHRDDVIRVHAEIEQRNTRGNPPPVQAKLAEARRKRLAWQRERQALRENNAAGTLAGR